MVHNITMAEQSNKPPPPSPDATWKEFTAGLPGFPDALSDGMDCIIQLAHEATVASGASLVIAMLTGSLAENLNDIVFLCANERRDGALRLLRTPYEKYLYAHFISNHPENAEDFLQFDSIQAKNLMTEFEMHYEYRMSDRGETALEKMIESARAKFRPNRCKSCGDSLPRMWTKVTPEQMARDAGLQGIHVFAYRYATLFIHPSWRGVSDQVAQSVNLPSILVIVHKLILETIKLQWLQFKKTKTISGSTAKVVHKLVELNSVPPKSEPTI